MGLPTNEIRAVDLIDDAIRQGDTVGFLERFLAGWQTEIDGLVAKFVELPYLLNPFRLPEIQGSDGKTTLDYALWLVGFTDELEQFVGQLSSDQKRLLLRSAAALWRAKGLPLAWLRWIRLLTGRTAWYGDYAHWRYLLDEDALGDGPVLLDPFEPAAPGGATYGAWESDLFIEDPQDAAMRALIADLVGLTRPNSERLRLRWVDVLETWDRSAVLSRWERSGALALDVAARELSLDATAAPAAAHHTRSGSTFAWYTVQAFLRATSANAIIDLDLHWTDDTHRVSARLDWTAGEVSIVVRNGAGEVVCANEVLDPLPEVGTTYRIEAVLSRRDGGGCIATVLLDGTAVASCDTATAPPAGGYPGWTLRQGTAAVGRLMAFDLPLTHDWLAPSGAVDDEV